MQEASKLGVVVMAGRHADVLPQPRSDQVPPRLRSPVVLPVVVAAEGVAFAALLGLDGSPLWQVARVLVTLILTALAVWCTRRARRTARGATAVVAGIVGTAAGAGVASGHVAKAGLDAAAVLAAIVLATGLFLLIWGAAALVRAIPGWWRLLAIPAAMAVLWFTLYPLTVAVNATNRPPGPLGSAIRGRLLVRSLFVCLSHRLERAGNLRCAAPSMHRPVVGSAPAPAAWPGSAYPGDPLPPPRC